MTTIEKIRAEIKRLRETNPPEYNFQNAEGYRWALDDILSFLDTLQEPDNGPIKARVKESGKIVEGFLDGKGHFDVPVDHGIFDRYDIDELVFAPSQEPEVDLEEECTRFYRTDEYKTAQTYGRGFEIIARHF